MARRVCVFCDGTPSPPIVCADCAARRAASAAAADAAPRPAPGAVPPGAACASCGLDPDGGRVCSECGGCEEPQRARQWLARAAAMSRGHPVTAPCDAPRTRFAPSGELGVGVDMGVLALSFLPREVWTVTTVGSSGYHAHTLGAYTSPWRARAIARARFFKHCRNVSFDDFLDLEHVYSWTLTKPAAAALRLELTEQSHEPGDHIHEDSSVHSSRTHTTDEDAAGQLELDALVADIIAALERGDEAAERFYKPTWNVNKCSEHWHADGSGALMDCDGGDGPQRPFSVRVEHAFVDAPPWAAPATPDYDDDGDGSSEPEADDTSHNCLSCVKGRFWYPAEPPA